MEKRSPVLMAFKVLFAIAGVFAIVGVIGGAMESDEPPSAAFPAAVPRREFILATEELAAGDAVILQADRPCNFMLMIDADLTAYQAGMKHGYYGGHTDTFPAKVTVPHAGRWHIVLDSAGKPCELKHTLSVRRVNSD